MLTTLRRGLTRTTSALALLGLTVGVPAGLLTFVGTPLPARAPSLGDVGDTLTHPMSDQLLITGMAAVVWLLWLLLVASILVEIAAAARGVTAPRPWLLRPTQGLAAALVAGLTAGVLAPTLAAPLTPPVGGAPPIQPVAVVTSPAATVAPTTVDPTVVRIADVTYLTAMPSTLTAAASHITVVIKGCGHRHTVVKHESLWHIAQMCLGDPHRWPEIFHLNKGRHWPHVSGHTTLTNPNLIFPGWVLILPDDAVAPPDAQPVNPPVTVPTQPTRPTAPAPAAPPPSTAPATSTPTTTTPATTAPATAATTAGPAASATPSPAPAASDSHHSDGSDQPPSEGDHNFIEVTGGFVSAALAAGLLFAAAMVWRRRRQRYRPTPITSPVLDDPDLAPPLAALTHLRQTLRRQRPDLLSTPEPGPSVREYVGADVKPPLPPSGPTGAELAGVARLPVSAGLGLDGPGALHAARGLLVAALTAGGAAHPDAQSQVVIPASTLASLLGVSAVDLPAMRRLTVTANVGDAITHVEEEIIRRTRIVTDHDVADVAALREAHPLAEPVPQLLLIADIPEPRQHQRLANAIHLGEKVDIGAALIGAWPAGVTLTVALDGSVTGSDTTSQVGVLDTDATAAALAMLAEAHGDTIGPVPDNPPQPTAHHPTPTPHPVHDTPPMPAPTAPTPTAPDVPPRVAVRVLGPPAILGPDGEPMRGLRGKALELLVYLAVNRAGASLADIMVALWPDAKVDPAKNLLSVNVANLRNTLRAANASSTVDSIDERDGSDDADGEPVPGRKRRRDEAGPIPNTGSRYHLDPAFVQVDWWTVLDEYANVAAAGDDDTRRRHLAAAVDAVAGPLAEGIEYDWILIDGEHVRRRLVKVFVQAADLTVDDDPHNARVLYDRACQLDPLSDDLARCAMRAAAAIGDADAIRYRLDTLRRALTDENLYLDEATEELAKDLLRQLAPPS